ncbi:metallophosphoesterase family protein [Candidatus Woesearchaeota archaeon]|nr:metallophosphoesterase family protein [Candidatus Woesearchaeota archaeon]
MRILGAADFHGDKTLVEKLADKAEKEHVDLVILCGDLIEDDSSENIVKPFTDKQKKVLLISGNHESIAAAEFLATMNDAKHLHGYSVKYEDVGIFGCGSANVGVHGLTEEEIFDTLKQGHDKINYLEKKIMVTHVHPKYSAMANLSVQNWGSVGVSKAVKAFQPDILFCSHLHEAAGIEEKIGKTWVINVGAEGKIIDL